MAFSGPAGYYARRRGLLDVGEVMRQAAEGGSNLSRFEQQVVEMLGGAPGSDPQAAERDLRAGLVREQQLMGGQGPVAEAVRPRLEELPVVPPTFNPGALGAIGAVLQGPEAVARQGQQIRESADRSQQAQQARSGAQREQRALQAQALNYSLLRQADIEKQLSEIAAGRERDANAAKRLVYSANKEEAAAARTAASKTADDNRRWREFVIGATAAAKARLDPLREQLFKEISELHSQYNATDDPAEKNALRKQMEDAVNGYRDRASMLIGSVNDKEIDLTNQKNINDERDLFLSRLPEELDVPYSRAQGPEEPPTPGGYREMIARGFASGGSLGAAQGAAGVAGRAFMENLGKPILKAESAVLQHEAAGVREIGEALGQTVDFLNTIVDEPTEWADAMTANQRPPGFHPESPEMQQMNETFLTNLRGDLDTGFRPSQVAFQGFFLTQINDAIESLGEAKVRELLGPKGQQIVDKAMAKRGAKK